MMLKGYTCQEKKKEENLPALKTALTHQYNGLKTTFKIVEKDLLQLPKTILTTREQATSHSRKLELG